MADVELITSKRIKVYKDGVYQGTLTGLTTDSTQNVLEKYYIGDDVQLHIPTNQVFEGSMTRDMTDETWIEQLVGKLVVTKFVTSGYDSVPDAVKTTLTNSSGQVDLSFTTPNKTGLKVEKVTLNLKRINRFEGGLIIEIWQGLAGTGTLKATFTVDEAFLPTSRAEFIDLNLKESSEISLTANIAHTMRIKKAGTITGSLQLYGPTAASTAYYAITYEMSNIESADYMIDIVMLDKDGNSVLTLRDTGITFLSNGVTINPNELISEVTSWKATNRIVV